MIGKTLGRAWHHRPPLNPLRWVTWLRNHPWPVTAWFAVLVVAHSVGAWFLGWLNPFWPIQDDVDTGIAFASLMAGASAILAGMSGVIVMFGLQANGPRFQRFRRRGGEALVHNWTASIGLAFLALGASVAGFLFAAAAFRFGVILTAELSVVLLAHAAIRVLWLFRQLVDGVTAMDHIADREERMPDPERLRFRARGDHRSS